MTRKILTGLIVITLSIFSLQSALAKGGGNGAGMKGQAGGRSSNHMGERGWINSNAQHRLWSTRGLERAQQRMSEQGKKHRKVKQRNNKKDGEDDKD